MRSPEPKPLERYEGASGEISRGRPGAETIRWNRGNLGRYPFTVAFSIVSRWGPGCYWECNRSNRTIIEVVTKGTATFVQDGVSSIVAEGDAFIGRRGAPYRFQTGPSGLLHKRGLYLTGPLLETVLRHCGLFHCDVVRIARRERVLSLLHRIHALLSSSGSGCERNLSALGYEFVLEIADSAPGDLPAPVSRLVRMIVADPARRHTNRSLAALCGLSVAHMNRLFKRHVGVTPLRLREQECLRQARHLLRETFFSVKEIAHLSGFDDPAYFCRRFAKAFGMPPTRVRRGTAPGPPA